MDGRPNRRKKAAFSNAFGVVCEYCLKYTYYAQNSSINACLMFASLCYVTQNEFKI